MGPVPLKLEGTPMPWVGRRSCDFTQSCVVICVMAASAFLPPQADETCCRGTPAGDGRIGLQPADLE